MDSKDLLRLDFKWYLNEEHLHGNLIREEFQGDEIKSRSSQWMTAKNQRPSHSLVKIDKHWQWQGLEVVIRLMSEWSARAGMWSPRCVVVCTLQLCIDTVQGCRQGHRKVSRSTWLERFGFYSCFSYILQIQSLSFGRWHFPLPKT